MLYRAFISYSHASDGKLAPALQSGLQSFARPWYRRRAMRVFRDKTSLAVTPALWPAIERALSQSEFFLLLASPAAASSQWVRQEVAYWMSQKTPQTLLIVLTDGTMTWDRAARDFDWAQTTALARDAGLRFEDEPLYLDLRWARVEEQVSMRNPRFRDAIADLAATLHGRPKDDLIGEDVRRHRGAMRLAWSAVATLTLLTVAAIVGAYIAVQQRNLANDRLAVAVSRQLSVEALGVESDRLDLALLLAVEANRQAPTAEAAATLKGLLDRASRLAVFLHEPTESLAFDPTGRVLALGRRDGSIQRIDSRTLASVGSPLRLPPANQIVAPPPLLQQPMGLPMTDTPKKLSRLVFDPSGRSVLVASPADYNPPPYTVFQWELESDTPRLRRVDRGHYAGINSSGQTVALFERFAGGNRALFWNAQERRLVSPPMASHDGSPLWLVFSGDGDRMLVGYHDDALETWTGLLNQPVARVTPAPAQLVTAAAFTGDGRTVFVGTSAGALMRFDVEAGVLSPPMSGGHAARVVGLFVGAADGVVTSVSEDGVVLQWSTQRAGDGDLSSRPIGRLPPPVGAAIFNADGSTVAAFQRVSNEDLGPLTLWARRSPRGIVDSAAAFSQVFDGAFAGERLPIVPAATRVANSFDKKLLIARGALQWSFHAAPVVFDPGGRLIAMTVANDRVALFRLDERRSLGWHPAEAASGMSASALSPDGRILAWGSGDVVYRLDLESGHRLDPLRSADGRVVTATFSGDGRWFAFADLDSKTSNGRLHVVNNATGQQATTEIAPGASVEDLQGGRGMIVFLAFLSDGRRLVSQNYAGDVISWDIASGAASSPVRIGESLPLRVAVHATRPLVGLTADGEIVQVIDLTNDQPRPVRSITLPQPLSSLAFQPTTDRLTVGTDDGAVRFWDIDGGQAVGDAITLPAAPTNLAYDAHGRHLAVVFHLPTGSAVQLWDVERRQPVVPDFSAPNARWYQIALAADGRRLLWSTEGRPPIVWDTQRESWLARACAMANRDLTRIEWARFLAGLEYRRTCGPQGSR